MGTLDGLWAPATKGILKAGCETESVVSQLNLTRWDPMDCSLRGSSVHGILPGKDTGVGCHFLL